MQHLARRFFTGFLTAALAYLILVGIGVAITDHSSRRSDPVENHEWIATSKSWLDRQLCSWLELCGTAHLDSSWWVQKSPPQDNDRLPEPPMPDGEVHDHWNSGLDDSASWSHEERREREIPQYVLDHAPYVHLFSGEQFWPGDLPDHLLHTTPHLNYTPIYNPDIDYNISNLNELNDYAGGLHGRFLYLQSNDNVEERPKWLGGAVNIPTAPDVPLGSDSQRQRQKISTATLHPQGATTGESSFPTLMPSTNGRCGSANGFTCKGSGFGECCSIYGWCGKGPAYCGEPCDALGGECNDPWQPRPLPHGDLRRDLHNDLHKPSAVGRSSAPAILIVVRKEGGILDAFWFFFYSYNLGQKVFNIRFGNHVGDWEHTMIRFRHGVPESIFLSEHDFGDAFHWEAVEKYLPAMDGSSTILGTWSNETAGRIAKRPVLYSAVGSHAMYATPGVHPYILPWGLLHDQTDRGPLWDPSLNFQSFVYDIETKVARSSNLTPRAPTAWFDYAGHWGDKYYPLADPRQYRFAGQYHYVNGPTGPKFKNLGRASICQSPSQPCRLRHWVGDAGDRRMRFPLLPPENADGSEDGGLPGGNLTDEKNTRRKST